MIYVTLGIALVAVFMAWQANRKNKYLTERIGQLNSRIFKTRQELLEAQEGTRHDLTALRIELLKSQGTFKVTGDMPVEEVLMIHPLADQVLGSFHIGGCSSCAVDGSQRLDLAVASSGQPLEPVLVALNRLLTDEQNGTPSAERLKTPNVELTF
jgi:hypothetical protein